MSRRSTNTHALKQRAHPWRVELEIPADGWGDRRAAIDEAAQHLSGDRWYSWSPSRPWPPVTVYAFAAESAREAFIFWIAGHLPGRPWIAPPHPEVDKLA